MNFQPSRYPPGLLPDWVLAPLYTEGIPNALSLWPSHGNHDISLSFPSSLTRPRVSVAQTLVDLTLPKPHQCIAKQEVKELPFAVIKPKAIRLYDIHIGVESRLPGSGPGIGFEEPSSMLSCLPSTFDLACRSIKTDVKETPPHPRRDGLAHFYPSPSLLTGASSTNPTDVDKHIPPFCSCYQRGCPDAGYKEYCTRTPSNVQHLLPFCAGFSAQSATQSLFGTGVSNMFGQPVLPLRQQHLPQNKICADAQTFEKPSAETPRERNRVHTDQQGHGGFLSLTPTLTSCGDWSHALRLSQMTRDRNSSQGIYGHDSLPIPVSKPKCHTHKNHEPCSNLTDVGNPLNFRGRPPSQGSQKLFLHPWGSFQKHKDFRERQFQERPCYKSEERVDHGMDFPTTVTKGTRSYSRKTPTESRFLFNKRSLSGKDRSKYLNRAGGLKKTSKMKPNSKAINRFSHQTCSNSLEPTGPHKIYPFQDGYRGMVNVSPLSETMSRGEGHIQGVSSTERKVFRCPQCRYVTDRKNNLKRHIVTMHHTSSKTLECCGIAFQSKAALRDHNSVFHKGGYRCSLCARNFCRKALLRRHLTVHSGQKDFFCEQCGYATSHKSNLERHQKVHGKREEGVTEIEQVCQIQSNYKIGEIDTSEEHDSALCLNTTNATNVVSKSCVAQKRNRIADMSGKSLNFRHSPERGHRCNRNTFIDEHHMPYYLGSGLTRNNDDAIALVQPMLNPSTDTESIERRSSNNECISPVKEICETRTANSKETSDSKQENFAEIVFKKFSKSKHPTNSRSKSDHKFRRSRGLLSKRIRETYSDHKRLSALAKERLHNSHPKSCIREEKRGSFQKVQNDSKPCDELDISLEREEILFPNNNHSFGAEETKPWLHADLNFPKQKLEKDSRDKFENIKSNTKKKVSPQIYEDNHNQSPDAKHKNAVPLLLLPSTSGSYDSERIHQRTGLCSTIKRSKSKMCDVVYSCPECGDAFLTQLKLGQHKCSFTASTPNFCLPLVKSYQKDCV